MSSMEFLLAAFVGFLLLALASVAIVEGACLISRMYARLSYWFRYSYLSWSSERQVRALKRRYGSTKGNAPLGQLRFTRTRAVQLEELSNGPAEPPHGA